MWVQEMLENSRASPADLAALAAFAMRSDAISGEEAREMVAL